MLTIETTPMPTPTPAAPSKHGSRLVFPILIVTLLVAAGAVFFFMTQPQLRNENANATTNANVNAVANANTTTNTNATTVVNETQTVTYQRADHGLSLVLPAGWTASSSGMGTKEGSILLSSRMMSGTDSVFLNVTFYENSESSLDAWVEKRVALMEEQYNATVTTETRTLGKQAVVYSLMESVSGDGNTTSHTITYFIEHQDRVYVFTFDGTLAAIDGNGTMFDAVLGSVEFIATKPLLTIVDPSAKSRVGSTLTTTLSVTWNATAQELNMTDAAVDETTIASRSYYDVGTVTGGTYDGRHIVNILETPQGPVFTPNLYRVLYDPTNLTFVYLEKHSYTLENIVPAFEYDAGATIEDLAAPVTIAVPNSDALLTHEPYPANKLFATETNLTKKFTDDAAGDVYFSTTYDCFVVETADHMTERYHYQLPFVTNFTEKESVFGANAAKPNVTWTDGTKITDEYTFNEATGGCGTMQCMMILGANELSLADLKVVGTTNTGDTVYEYRDTSHAALTQTYESYSTTYYAETPKATYDEFVADHPVFYWQDPFGMWLRFKKVEFLPAVECGKPVIYLYPESALDATVAVAPNGGFTVTEPAYPVGGWKVHAKPDGTLTDLTSGRSYGSLFWEGKGVDYTRPKNGFLFARETLTTELPKVLARLGLNEKERAEFLDFWLPRMNAKPYYFVTFVPQAQFDALAPLTVSPRPETVIRVFMDYAGLDNPVPVEPLQIATPERKGFTVVEWGGALHK